MEKLRCKDYYDLAEMIFDSALYDELDVSLIADYEVIYNVLKDLFVFDDNNDLIAADIELGNGIADGYDGPYILSLGADWKIWIQKAIVDNSKKIVFSEAEVSYVQPKYISDVLKRYDSDTVVEVYIGEEGKDEEPKFQLLIDQDDKPYGFEYNDEGDGYCCHMRYCSCDNKDIDNLVDMYNSMAEVFGKWMK